MAARTSLPTTPRSRCPASSRSRKARKWSTSRRRVRRAPPPGRSAPFDVRNALIPGPGTIGPFIFLKTEEKDSMAKPNYAFQKRQRELAKKQKKEEKKKQKEAAHAAENPAPPAPGEEPKAPGS